MAFASSVRLISLSFFLSLFYFWHGNPGIYAASGHPAASLESGKEIRKKNKKNDFGASSVLSFFFLRTEKEPRKSLRKETRKALMIVVIMVRIQIISGVRLFRAGAGTAPGHDKVMCKIEDKDECKRTCGLFPLKSVEYMSSATPFNGTLHSKDTTSSSFSSRSTNADWILV